MTDGGVTILLVGDVAQETAHRRFTMRADEQIDTGKITGAHKRGTKLIALRLTGFQFRIIKVKMRVLNCLVVVGSHRPACYCHLSINAPSASVLSPRPRVNPLQSHGSSPRFVAPGHRYLYRMSKIFGTDSG